MDAQGFVTQRKGRVDLLKAKLYDTLIKPDGGAFLAKTGSLLQGSCLRGKKLRKKFSMIIETFPVDDVGERTASNHRVASRFWTKRLFHDTLVGLIHDYQLELPRIPGFDFAEWVKDQADLLQDLAKRARRNSNYRPSRSSSIGSSMEHLETLPYNPEDRNFWPSN